MNDKKTQASNSPERLPLTSMDMTDTLIGQLCDAAPQIFSEGRVDFAKLQAALGEHVETNPERYGLTWAGKRDAFRNVQVPSVATLRPQPEESVNWDSTENLIIEGDNLEVLKLLQKPYHGKVKMIYIDPPYNTGNEFIYPDNFREGLDEYLRYTGQLGEAGTATSTNKDTSGRYHSNWLNMMYPRLFLARNLLKEDGVIFVSIDDHEVHNLRMLMEEIFGEEGFVGVFVWRRRVGSSLATSWISADHEYVLAYSKDPASIYVLGDERDMTKYSIPDGTGRFYASMPLTVGMNKDMRPNQWYELINPKTGKGYWPPATRVWGYYPPTMEKKIQENLIIWPDDYPDRNMTTPRLKTYPEDAKRDRKPLSTWMIEKVEKNSEEVDSYSVPVSKNEEGTRVLNELFTDSVFSYPKPPSLIKSFVAQFTKEDDLVLDFFAGSGTTGHAVLDVNTQDGGNRRFILVQLPEKTDNPQYPTIAHITRERVRRVIEKIKNEDDKQLALEGKKDLGFRAFKLDSSNFKIWQASAEQSAEKLAEQLHLYADNVQPNRDEQDRLYELILKSGHALSEKVEAFEAAGKRAYSVAGGTLLVCMAEHLDQETLRALFARKPQTVLCLDTAFDGNDALKTNIVLEAKSHGIVFKTV